MNSLSKYNSLVSVTDIEIGFEFSSYTYVEADVLVNDMSPPGYPAIYLVKSIMSEQIFEVVVTLSSGGSATPDEDFRTGEGNQQNFDFPTSAERLLFPFLLFDDANPELREEATLGVQEQTGSVADFDLAANFQTRIVILDDGDRKYF